MGRIYIPEADMAQAGYSCESLKGRNRGDAFSKLMAVEYHRAKGFYKSARAALDPRDRRAMLPAEIMAQVYEGLLDHLKANDFPVFGSPVKPPSWKKVLAAGRAWLYSRGLSS
jgi:phytoene/squalene synthetase